MAVSHYFPFRIFLSIQFIITDSVKVASKKAYSYFRKENLDHPVDKELIENFFAAVKAIGLIAINSTWDS